MEDRAEAPLIWVLNLGTRLLPLGVLSITVRSQPATGYGEAVIDFTNPPGRAEPRRLLNRLRENAPLPVRRTTPPPPPPPPPPPHNQAKARSELKEIIFDVNRIWLTEGEATRMMAGHAIKIGNRAYWSDTSGRLRYERSPKLSPLERFNALAQKHCNSVNV